MRCGRLATAPLDRSHWEGSAKGAENQINDKPRLNDTHRKFREPGQFVEPSPAFPSGWGGIRTPGRLSPTAVFKTAALDHSATHPDTRIPTGYCRVLLAERKPTTPRKPHPVSHCPLIRRGYWQKKGAKPVAILRQSGRRSRRQSRTRQMACRRGCPSTEPMAKLFQPDDQTWKMLRELPKHQPVSAEELREARERLRQPLTELRQQGGSRLRRDMGEEGIVKKWERTPPLLNGHLPGSSRPVRTSAVQSSPRVPCVSRRMTDRTTQLPPRSGQRRWAGQRGSRAHVSRHDAARAADIHLSRFRMIDATPTMSTPDTINAHVPGSGTKLVMTAA